MTRAEAVAKLTAAAWYDTPKATAIIRSLIVSPPALVERRADYINSVDGWLTCERDGRVERLDRICNDAFLAAERLSQDAGRAFLAGPLVDDVLEAIEPRHRRRVLWSVCAGDPVNVAAIRDAFGLAVELAA